MNRLMTLLALLSLTAFAAGCGGADQTPAPGGNGAGPATNGYGAPADPGYDAEAPAENMDDEAAEETPAEFPDESPDASDPADDPDAPAKPEADEPTTDSPEEDAADEDAPEDDAPTEEKKPLDDTEDDVDEEN